MGISKNNQRNRWLHIRLTQSEYMQLKSAIKHTANGKMSAYARKLLLGQPVIILTRDTSFDDFIQEVAVLKKELSAIGNNFNQVVRKINSMEHSAERKIWFPMAISYQKKLVEKVDSIQENINRFAKSWYQKS